MGIISEKKYVHEKFNTFKEHNTWGILTPQFRNNKQMIYYAFLPTLYWIVNYIMHFFQLYTENLLQNLFFFNFNSYNAKRAKSLKVKFL